ncbi:hypothetical protein ACHAWO_012772 [Cyclotella atomus]|uniref:Uncharacterized protein n=1 Tax=Cyclotella atomus TaxID=382360 RepID=A0ABD3PDJ2_9STRA
MGDEADGGQTERHRLTTLYPSSVRAASSISLVSRSNHPVLTPHTSLTDYHSRQINSQHSIVQEPMPEVR